MVVSFLLRLVVEVFQTLKSLNPDLCTHILRKVDTLLGKK